MPIGFVLLALVLLWLTISALLARRTVAALLCLSALFYVARMLWDQHRRRGLVRSLQGTGEAQVCIHGRPVRPDNVLVALLYPDQLPHLRKLLAFVEPTSAGVIVLALEPSPGHPEAAHAALFARASVTSSEPDPRLRSEAMHAAERADCIVALMTTAGADPAHLALKVAQSLRSSRLLVMLAEDPRPDEQRRHARSVWTSLAPPRPALRVEMVAPEGDDRMVFDLGIGAEAHADTPERANR